MKKIFITGIGIISTLGVHIAELWENLNKHSIEDVNQYTMPIKVPLIIEKSDIRRMSRYAYMALYSTKIIADKRDNEINKLDKNKVGTIFNTGYGPLSTNIKFGEKVIKKNPDFASPTMFSSTVSNACVGNVCINTGFKGPSTILLGSNNIGYAYELISSGSAKGIFTCGIEEYCEELLNSFNEFNNSDSIGVSEASVSILMESLEEGSEEYLELEESILCEIVAYSDRNIGAHPLIVRDLDIDSNIFASNMKSLFEIGNIKETDVSFVVTAKSGLKKSDLAEDIAIKEIFSDDIIQISPKLFFGETLGASLSLNTLIAALCLSKQEVPKLFTSEKIEKIYPIKYAVVNGYDVSGNTTSILLKTKKRI